MTMFSISFTYRKARYEALIRVKQRDNGHTEYRITVMNGDLEMMLYGHHIITEENGQLCRDCSSLSMDVVELKAAITDSLEKHLNKSVLVEA